MGTALLVLLVLALLVVIVTGSIRLIRERWNDYEQDYEARAHYEVQKAKYEAKSRTHSCNCKDK